jgi:hypothetical protein
MQDDAVKAQTLLKTNGSAAPLPADCSGITGFFYEPTACIGRTIGAIVSAFLIFVSSWILAVAGALFNWLVMKTIILFGAATSDGGVYPLIQSAVETAWSAFRDIANIFIIGIFTFIAISIIVGLKEYGQKKMIARVLIIAVLINFSLLFAKIIIDASNYSATQMFNAAGFGSLTNQAAAGAAQSASNPSTGTNPLGTFAQSGIAGQFVSFMGVQSFSQALGAVSDIAQAKDDGWIAFLHGLFSALVLLAAAAVLLYGSFLLVARAILLVFLLVTAAIAFASYLIPKWEKSSYGWDAWWGSLLWCATLAPILMFFLWMSLSVANAMKSKTGTLGDLLTHPTDGNDLNALFVYVIVLGLLFVSFKLSSMWAKKVGVGFSLASLIPGTALGIALRGTGMLGRAAVGDTALRAKTALRGYVNDPMQPDRRRGFRGLLNRTALTTADKLSRASFDALRPKALATAASALGVPKGFLGAKPGEGGIEGVLGRKAKAADEQARRIGPTDAQKEETRLREERRIRQERRERRDTAQAALDQQRQLLAEITNREQPAAEERAKRNQPGREGAERELSQARERLVTLQRQQATAEEEHASRLRIAEQRAANAQDANTRRTAEGDVARVRRERREAMAGEAQRIQAAQAEVARRQQPIQQLDAAATQAARDELAPRVEELNRTIAENTRIREQFSERGDDAAGQRAGRTAVHEQDVALRRALLWDKRAAPKIEDEMKAHGRRQQAADIRAALRDAEGSGGGRAAPAAPAAPPPAPGGGGH